MSEERSVVAVEQVESRILVIRGKKVMLDRDLAELYGVTTKRLNEQVRRNRERFPGDFMFQLTWKEARNLARDTTRTGYQSKSCPRSQFATLESGSNIKYRPYAFTEQGVAMLSSVLRSKRAAQVNIEIMRAFVRMRGILAAHADLARKLAELEDKVAGHDQAITSLVAAIRRLTEKPRSKDRRRIGFLPEK